MRINLTPLKQAMLGQLQQNDVIANNLANINTRGFKKDLVFFEVLNNDPDGETKPRMATDFAQGALTQTSNPLDVALSGSGFFTVETENGIAYTRDGHFKLDENGVLRTQQGYAVLGEGGLISLVGDDLTPKNITITQDGEIYLDDQYVDRLAINDFEDYSQIKKRGDNVFITADDVEPLPVEKVEVRQGFLEESNINPAEEMIQLIEVQRQFESIQRMVRALDETFRKAAGEIGKYF
ncbi:MAG: flagellar basal-body rod protein FlgF [Calditrichaeota bacterium]|nr:flagellar basal-body rod protein FlgF [Calditrichota bacterium]